MSYMYWDNYEINRKFDIVRRTEDYRNRVSWCSIYFILFNYAFNIYSRTADGGTMLSAVGGGGGGNRSTRRRACPNNTLSTTNSSLKNLVSNRILHDEMPGDDCLSWINTNICVSYKRSTWKHFDCFSPDVLKPFKCEAQTALFKDPVRTAQ